MGRSFDRSGFTGPSISLLYNKSLNNEEKAIFIILLNVKSEMQLQSLCWWEVSLIRQVVYLSFKHSKAQGNNTSKADTEKSSLVVIRAAWSLISK